MLTLFSASIPAIQAQEQPQTLGPRIENLADRNDLEMRSVPAAVSSIDLVIERMLIQENRCQDVETLCTNKGGNEFLIGSQVSQVDAFILLHLLQENECSFNNVICTNEGLNRVSLGPSSFEGSSVVTEIDIDAGQELNQKNQCERVTECFSSSINGIAIGNSISPQSRSVVSNVDANIKQDGEYSNTCNSDDSPDTVCFASGGNSVGIGISDLGGISSASNIDIDANQEIKQITDCSNLPESGDCINSNDNGITIGFASDPSTSTVSDVESDIDQKIDVLIDCNNSMTCQQESGNSVLIASAEGNDLFSFFPSTTVSEIDADIEQSTKATVRCSDMTICDQ
jgi:hypothetical protein